MSSFAAELIVLSPVLILSALVFLCLASANNDVDCGDFNYETNED